MNRRTGGHVRKRHVGERQVDIPLGVGTEYKVLVLVSMFNKGDALQRSLSEIRWTRRPVAVSQPPSLAAMKLAMYSATQKQLT